MKQILIATLREHRDRLEGLVIHKDVKPHIASYIREFLLNKRFYELMEQINQEEQEEK